MNHEKASKDEQWRETPIRPTTRPWGKTDIESHHAALVKSYKCKPGEIRWEFERISEMTDIEYDTSIMLVYKMQTIVDKLPKERIIYSIKLPIPVELRSQYRTLMREKAKKTTSATAPAPSTPNILSIDMPIETDQQPIINKIEEITNNNTEDIIQVKKPQKKIINK